MHLNEFSSGIDSARGHVLKLKGNDVDIASKLSHTVKIVVRGRRFYIRDLPGWCIRVRRESVDPVSHLPRLDREHPAKLAAAKNADRRSWRDKSTHAPRRNACPPLQAGEIELED